MVVSCGLRSSLAALNGHHRSVPMGESPSCQLRSSLVMMGERHTGFHAIPSSVHIMLRCSLVAVGERHA
jgi:hypothetical protein